MLFAIGAISPTIYSSVNTKFKLDSLTDFENYTSQQGQYEIVFIYFSSSSCPACNNEKLPDFLIKTKNIVRDKSSQLGYGFHSIGISKDPIHVKELIYLSKIGSFDEINTGKSWSSLGALKYLNDFSAPNATPQVIISFRKYKEIINNNITSYRSLENEDLLIRKVGLNEIFSWDVTKLDLSKIE